MVEFYKELSTTVPEEDRSRVCVDDDPGRDRYLRGYVKIGVLKYADYCKGDKLYQYVCGSSTKATLTRPIDCPNGCDNGACLR